MLFLAPNFTNVPVMSLQTGAQLAITSEAVIDPRTLTIVAFYLEGDMLDRKPALLMTQDIRESGDLGFIIDSSEEIMAPDDMFSFQEVLKWHFELIGISTVDNHGRKLGKVVNYGVDIDSFVIEQLYIQRPFLQNLTETELLIHRSQIISVTDEQITVSAPDIKAGQKLASQAKAFINPFSAEPKGEA
ncbi:MAG TPA: hypothetical protein VFZ48_01405 [Candidatus Saccharimonadales bacterium]